MNVFVEFTICDNIYNNLHNFINNIQDSKKEEILNGMLIKYRDKKWIIGTILNIDGNNMNTNMNIIITFSEYYFTYNIKEVKSLLDDDIVNYINNSLNNNIIFFDSHLNLFLIRFEENIDEESFYDLNIYNIKDLLNIDYKNKNVNFTWLNTIPGDINYKINKTNEIILSSYYWNDEFICAPPIPYLFCKNTNNIVQSGSVAYDDDNNLVGIVSYVYENIIITPLMCIIRSLNYIYGHKLNIIKITTLPNKVSINYKVENCLMINNNYCKNLYNNHKKILKSQNINNSNITNSDINNSDISNYNINSNELYLMNKYKKYNLLSKGGLIRSIDNNKIDEKGNLIHNNISIPYRSYIWLFIKEDNINIEIYKNEKKSFNNTGINLSKLNTNLINYKFENNNGINIHEINYIKYNNKYLFELNEKFIDILQSLIFNNSYIKNVISTNKYNIKNKKIIIGINLDKILDINDVKILKICNKFSSIKDIKERQSKRSIKRYINKLLI
jgi:hypothetical protein